MVLLSDDVDKLDSVSIIPSKYMINHEAGSIYKLQTYMPNICNEYLVAPTLRGPDACSYKYLYSHIKIKDLKIVDR